MQALKHCRRVGELAGVPLKVAPLKFLHPKAVEVEYRKGNVALCHAVYKRIDGFLVVLGGKRRRQPESEGVSRGKSGLAGEGGVVRDYLFKIFSADNKVLNAFAGDGY